MADFFNEKTFPYPTEKARLDRYDKNNLMLEASHYDAFSILANPDFSEAYNRLRYVVVNFDGLVAKVNADMLFGEEVQIKAKGKKNQEWLETLYHENRLQTQFFESALSNAAVGDALLKIRVKNDEILVEDINPSIYFPHLNDQNVRERPEVEELAWLQVPEPETEKGYLIRELHIPGYIYTSVFEVKKQQDGTYTIEDQIDLEEFPMILGVEYVPEVKTGIDRNLLVHIPNFRYRGNAKYFGVSDFIDLETLQFALNNRMTKTDNILDKHSDPILAVPPGVLDENGQVRREAFNMIEIPEAGGNPPQYIVWNANLEAAFSEIDKLVEFMFMVSETSPDVLGIGKGQAETGRALKMRMLRTLAKRNRKRLYYDQAIKEALEIAQELSRATGAKTGGKVLRANPEVPNLVWSDGIVNDIVEETNIASLRVDSGLLSKKSAIKRLDGVTEEEATAELDAANKERGSFTSLLDSAKKE